MAALQQIAVECDRASNPATKVRAELSRTGVVIVADSRDGQRTASFLLSWLQLDAIQPDTAGAAVRATVERL